MSKKQKAARNKQLQRARQKGKQGPPSAMLMSLIHGLAIGLGLMNLVFGASTEPDEPQAPELPPPADDLELNPETGNYEPKK
jgi:hypothetical protein